METGVDAHKLLATIQKRVDGLLGSSRSEATEYWSYTPENKPLVSSGNLQEEFPDQAKTMSEVHQAAYGIIDPLEETLMPPVGYASCAGRIRTGLYRIYMDFTDQGPSEEHETDMIHMDTIIGAFAMLARIYQSDWDEVTKEFSMPAVSMDIASRTTDVPRFNRHDARFGYLLAMVFENGSVTGLRRAKE